jgi:hypothetical protein
MNTGKYERDLDCTWLGSWLNDLVDEDAPTAIRERAAEHLAHCYPCNEDKESRVELLNICRSALRHPDPRDRWEDLCTLLDQSRSSLPVTAPSLLNCFSMGLRVGAAAVLVAFLWSGIAMAQRTHDRISALLSPEWADSLDADLRSGEGPVLSLLGHRARTQHEYTKLSDETPQRETESPSPPA